MDSNLIVMLISLLKSPCCEELPQCPVVIYSDLVYVSAKVQSPWAASEGAGAPETS